MQRWGSIVLFLFVCAGFGAWVTWNSKSGADQYVDNDRAMGRDPAAIRHSYDFSDLDGQALDQATKQRLMAGARVLSESSQVGVELGHFVVKNSSGSKSFACDQYSTVILDFEADGSASSGDKPRMEVEGACQMSADINRISPLWIPVAKIMGEPVAEGEFDFRGDKPVKVRFANVIDAWPRTWALKTVRLQSLEGQSLQVEGPELHTMIPEPMILEFK